MIGQCFCSHSVQDALHGPGRRVMTPAKGKDGGVKWRCSVCLREYSPAERKAIKGVKV